MEVSHLTSSPTTAQERSKIQFFDTSVAQAQADRAAMENEMTDVFIVDDHQIFRDGLRALLESTGEITVVGDASSGDGLLEKLAAVKPALVLMDIQMPGTNGIALTRMVKDKYPEIAVLMLTMFEDDQSVFSAMQAGASGYVLKGISNDDMIASILTAASGGAVFSQNVAQYMLAYFRRARSEDEATAAGPELSQRELDVLQLIAEGADNPEIARRLSLTPKTVRNYVSRVLKKLDATDRSSASSIARDQGLIDS